MSAFFLSLSRPTLAGVLAGGLLAGAAGAADWTWYRGPLGTGHSPEKIAKTWPSGGPKVLWKVPSPGGFSSFAVGSGRAFCLELRPVAGADQETLVARDAETGRELWIQALGGIKVNDGGQSGTPDNKGGDGPRSTPAVDGKHVYTLSARLVLQCFEAATGKEAWKHDLPKEHGGRNIQWENAQSPLIEDDLVLVAGGGAGQSLLAFHKKTGKVVWKDFDETMTHATAVPATLAGKRQVIFFVKSGLLAVEPATGKELWRYAFPFRISTAASPVVAGDIVYCSAGYGVGAGAVRVKREGAQWSATEIYRVPGDKQLANHWSTPVLFNGHLYGMFQFKEYGSGPVKCVDVATGSIQWEKGGFGPGHVIGVDGHVLALSDAGELVLIEATPKSYREAGRADVLEGKCWTTPVVSGGRVFARSSREAVCLDVSVKRAAR
ncbi:MAG: PQQ-binding-like beta-propeller repeat protein [Verrucomicrobiota bacterium]